MYKIKNKLLISVVNTTDDGHVHTFNNRKVLGSEYFL